ncbi:hypothetical protein [Halalkalibacter hemicellulosilyticus]|uniref:Uncharacterized protein n=1 Tax=Halalkalibacter hemicellulosilyticusJCM 9152 TaxID=1236971 RepID=W4QGP5_9BACI|nr:hypothetical protein [Halalkalibacter hemicellulosilyticus]GAE31261.1 hypothetical protein JCM9152_2718 [Halalkalibacter hemicellulosilyticusJCM 9152]
MEIKQTRPFFILGIGHAILFLITFVRFKKKTIALLWISIGFTYLFEYVVLNWLRMYRYKPGVFRNAWVDSVFGAFLSQAFFVPVKAVFITLFQFGWKTKVGLAMLFGGVEVIFLRKGVFINRTWRTPFTIIGIIFYFWFIDQWWVGFRSSKRKLFAVISVYLSNVIHYTNVLFFSFAFTKLFRFQFPYHTSRSKDMDHFIVAPTYALVVSLLPTINTLTKGRFKVIALCCTLLLDQLLFRFKILNIRHSNIIFFFMLHFVMLFVGDYTYSFLLGVQKEAVREDAI